MDAELIRTVRACELIQAAECDGLTSMQSWLRGHARLSPAAASRVVANGRALEHLPAVAAVFADGEITAEQVAGVAPVAGAANQRAAEEQDVDLSAIDAALAEVATTQPHVQLGRVVHHYLACLDPTAPSRTPPRAGR